MPLSVEAIGFDVHDDVPGDLASDKAEGNTAENSVEAAATRHGALGILLTPWFMNLVWLPQDAGVALANEVRTLGKEKLSFMVANEAGIGPYQMCSLFSPVFEFASQEAARETAQEVLRLLRIMPEPPPPPPPAPKVEAPSRRAFLTGRFGTGEAR